MQDENTKHGSVSDNLRKRGEEALRYNNEMLHHLQPPFLL